MEFTGFPVAALDFYDDLEVDNTQCFWEKHKHSTTRRVKAPMVRPERRAGRSSATRRCSGPTATCGSPRTRRRTRPTRARSCGSPTRPGGTSSLPRGVRTGGGSTARRRPGWPSIREAIATTRTAPSSRRSSGQLAWKGFAIGGDDLKTTPRGYDKDHPRIELLRHKSLIASRVHRLRAGHPHRRAARPRPQGLARHPAAGRVGPAARRPLTTSARPGPPRSR